MDKIEVYADNQTNASFCGTILPAQYVSASVYPFLLILCTMGNMLNIYMISQYQKICVKEVLLLCLATSDIFVMWIALPRFLNLHRLVLGITLTQHSFLFRVMGIFTWLQYTFQTTSDLILVIFSLERLAAFRFIDQHWRWQWRIQRVLFIVAGVVVFSAILMFEQAIDYFYLTTLQNGTPNWLTQWHRAQLLIDMIIPLVITGILLLLNIWLIFCITKQRNWTEHELSQFSESTRNALRKNCGKGLTKMDRVLLGCVGMYLVTQLPVIISNVVDYEAEQRAAAESAWSSLPLRHTVCSAVAPMALGQPYYSPITHFRPIIWILALVNYSANFFVYMGCSKSYRECFLLMIKQTRSSTRRISVKTRPQLQVCAQHQQEATPLQLNVQIANVRDAEQN